MDITIKIDDESRFKDLIENELAALTKEELHGVILGVIKEYFSKEENLKSLFYNEEIDRWGSKKTTRSEFFNRIMPDASVHEEEINILRKKFEEMLKNDEVVKKLIVQTWLEAFSSSIGDRLGVWQIKQDLGNIAQHLGLTLMH